MFDLRLRKKCEVDNDAQPLGPQVVGTGTCLIIHITLTHTVQYNINNAIIELADIHLWSLMRKLSINLYRNSFMAVVYKSIKQKQGLLQGGGGGGELRETGLFCTWDKSLPQFLPPTWDNMWGGVFESQILSSARECDRGRPRRASGHICRRLPGY